MRWTRPLATLAALTLGLGTALPAAAGMQVAGDDDKNLKVGALLQAHALVADQGAPGGGWGTEMYLRRMRLMVYGQLSPKINFFVETDNPKFGLNGDWSGNTFIQDAYVEFVLSDAFQVDAGFLLTPFAHHGLQGATSLLAVDYHPLLKYPAGSHKVWRDAGVMVRGLLGEGLLEYRLAVTNGVRGDATPVLVEDGNGDGFLDNSIATDARNQSDLPRITARVNVSFFDAEGGPGVGGMFYDGLYIKKTDAGTVSTKKVLSVGAAVDMQPGLNVSYGDPAVPTEDDPEPSLPVDSEAAYLAVAADVFWDLPLNADKTLSLNGQVNAFMYDYGDRSEGGTWYDYTGAGAYSGVGVMAEVGVRIDEIQPLVIVDWFDATKAASDTAGDLMQGAVGVNWWIHGHNASLKGQVGASRDFANEAWKPSVLLQTQLLI